MSKYPALHEDMTFDIVHSTLGIFGDLHVVVRIL